MFIGQSVLRKKGKVTLRHRSDYLRQYTIRFKLWSCIFYMLVGIKYKLSNVQAQVWRPAPVRDFISMYI